MAVIALEGIHFHAFHGYYEEENLMGGEFVIDIYVTLPSVQKAASSDDLDGTVNYETIYFICKAEMKKTSKMIENVAQRILDRLTYQYGEKVQSIKIRLKKLNPPLGGRVACAYVELESGSGGGGGSSKSRQAQFEEDFEDDDDFDEGNFDPRSLFG
ncbi:MAG: dihydroneopterin aldolase [Bacteroidota bacterium]